MSTSGSLNLLFRGLNYIVKRSRWELVCQHFGDRIGCDFLHLENADLHDSDGLALVRRANDEYMPIWTGREDLLLEPDVLTEFHPPDKLAIL